MEGLGLSRWQQREDMCSDRLAVKLETILCQALVRGTGLLGHGEACCVPRSDDDLDARLP